MKHDIFEHGNWHDTPTVVAQDSLERPAGYTGDLVGQQDLPTEE